MKRMKKYSYILLALPLLLGSCEACALMSAYP